MHNPTPGLPEFDYIKPASLAEASRFLADHVGEVFHAEIEGKGQFGKGREHEGENQEKGYQRHQDYRIPFHQNLLTLLDSSLLTDYFSLKICQSLAAARYRETDQRYLFRCFCLSYAYFIFC
mgnify:CR=1 FL=1